MKNRLDADDEQMRHRWTADKEQMKSRLGADEEQNSKEICWWLKEQINDDNDETVNRRCIQVRNSTRTESRDLVQEA